MGAVSGRRLEGRLGGCVMVALYLTNVTVMKGCCECIRCCNASLLSRVARMCCSEIGGGISVRSVPCLNSLVCIAVKLLKVCAGGCKFSLCVIPMLVLTCLGDLAFKTETNVMFLFLVFIFSCLVSRKSKVGERFTDDGLGECVSLVTVNVILVIVFILLARKHITNIRLACTDDSFGGVFKGGTFMCGILACVTTPVNTLGRCLGRYSFSFKVGAFGAVCGVLTGLKLVRQVSRCRSCCCAPLSYGITA